MIDVVIAGAGPDGLMVACELGLAGIRPIVLDPAPGPNPAARVNRIVGQAARILDYRGLYSALTGADAPIPVPHANFAGLSLDLAAVPASQLFAIPVQQFSLVQLLAERAGNYGTDIRWGHALTGFDQRDDGITVHVAGPDCSYDLTTQYLVGADGGTSTTRHLAGIEFPGMSSYDLVIRIGFDVVPPDEWIEPIPPDPRGPGHLPPQQFHRTDRGVFVYGEMGSRVAMMTYELDNAPHEQRNDGTAGEPPMSLAELQASAERVLGTDVPLRPVSRDAPLDLRRVAGINSRIASHYQVGRVFLVGDAAHVHAPIGGPGLNLGLQDGVNLGWKLAAVSSGRVAPALLATYEVERRPAAERLVMQTRAQLALFRPGPEVTALRDLFTELLSDPNNVLRISDLLSGADNHYTAGNGAHPFVGRWVPDFTVASASGRQRVAELARAGLPVLVDLTEDGAFAAAVTDTDDRLTVAVGRPVDAVGATAVLVRPDGYVAWASSQAQPAREDTHQLRAVLTQWFGI
ncbi:FAD-dependent monooxygenase [Mycobacterium cookii]|uniref:FAD-dependent oxidoreductase n=1 Tax=Mycobacterium cookii TaxID=1775 RepID=A0A7I7KSP9_9MYCO|nr:FAD-dependent monooxygenase [Mycobacterium cookii]MCV7331238.1 FAD-dependent monooxygenase [Mycobacterium cookii]BBX44804.1 FAD-dependent oxidoreductase [Mycobacterium cookii]